jgi:hypothetical protein
VSGCRLLSLCLLLPVWLTAAPPRPLVMAYYYTWYGTPWGKAGTFQKWSDPKRTGELAPKGTDADTVVLPPAIRQLKSGAYPLIGPYDSMNRDVVRWHIRLAKAAGIDAFLVDWWGDAGWQKPPHWTRDVFRDVVLPVAEEEHFKVVLFDEAPQFVDNFAQVKQWTRDAIKTYAKSPAYLKIDGKPAWAVYQLWNGKLSPDQARELIRETEAAVGPVYWIFDKLRARGKPKGGIELFCPDEWLAVKEIDCISGYAMFSTWRVDEYAKLKPLYTGFADAIHAAGKQVMLPVHPGHDNRRLSDKPYHMRRLNGKTYQGFWRAATEAGTDFVGITSFNEWPETTVIEPALTWPDPYLYLRLTAQFQGTSFEVPALPPLASLDPLMADFLKNQKPKAKP